MSNDWGRDAKRYQNEFRQSAAQLVGIAAGLVADRILTDGEIQFLHGWLEAHDEVSVAWPGNIILARVHAVLEDGIITDAERAYLIATLDDLIGAPNGRPAAAQLVTQLAFDEPAKVEINGNAFCLTGDFVYAPRPVCFQAIESRGGIVKKDVSRQIDYLVVGGLGSPEWKHGSYGTKIDRAMEIKGRGGRPFIIREDLWAAAL
jgi:NAD-dependent DNA ligase